MHFALVILLGFAAGILVGLMGIGGGIVVVPALVYLIGMDQHVAQGTSLFILLPPLGIGALYVYWRKGKVDLPAGILCAIGFLLGGWLGGHIAVGLSSRALQTFFGVFLMTSATLLWRQARQAKRKERQEDDQLQETHA
jgi:uncharacterized protein